MQKRCDRCVYAHLQDYGYSDWTTEGTTFKCMRNKNPHGEFDRWYGEDSRLLYAEQCRKFTPGDPVHLSVEGNEI